MRTFSRAWRCLHEITLNFDWFTELFAALLIGLSDHFGSDLQHLIENLPNTCIILKHRLSGSPEPVREQRTR